MEQLAALVKSVNDSRTTNDTNLEAIQASLELWQPAVTNLQQQLDKLRTQVGRIALHPALGNPATVAAETVARTASGIAAVDPGHDGPSGHGEIHDFGGRAHEVVTTLEPPSINSASHSSLLPSHNAS